MVEEAQEKEFVIECSICHQRDDLAIEFERIGKYYKEEHNLPNLTVEEYIQQRKPEVMKDYKLVDGENICSSCVKAIEEGRVKVCSFCSKRFVLDRDKPYYEAVKNDITKEELNFCSEDCIKEYVKSGKHIPQCEICEKFDFNVIKVKEHLYCDSCYNELYPKFVEKSWKDVENWYLKQNPFFNEDDETNEKVEKRLKNARFYHDKEVKVSLEVFKAVLNNKNISLVDLYAIYKSNSIKERDFVEFLFPREYREELSTIITMRDIALSFMKENKK